MNDDSKDLPKKASTLIDNITQEVQRLEKEGLISTEQMQRVKDAVTPEMKAKPLAGLTAAKAMIDALTLIDEENAAQNKPTEFAKPFAEHYNALKERSDWALKGAKFGLHLISQITGDKKLAPSKTPDIESRPMIEPRPMQERAIILAAINEMLADDRLTVPEANAVNERGRIGEGRLTDTSEYVITNRLMLRALGELDAEKGNGSDLAGEARNALSRMRGA